MAIVLTSKFNPFTYDELVKPAMEMTKAHQEVEQALGELKAESMKMQNLANKETDPIAHAQYQRYASDLALQAESLARSGLRTSSRRDLYDMASRYQAEIAPIDTANKKREALIKEQRALRLQNPTMLFEREAAGMSLDELIQNPNADYGHAISGDFLAKQVATAASVLAKEARDSEEGKGKLKKMMLPFQYEYIKQKGFSREAVMEAILRGPNANKILTGIVDGVIKSSGVLDWGDKSTIAKAYNYANQGLYSAIGETTSQIITDSYNMQDALARRQEARKSKNEKVKSVNALTGPRKVMTEKQIQERENQLKSFIEAGYIKQDKNGKYAITQDGMKAYRASVYAQTHPGYDNDAFYDPKTKEKRAQGIIMPYAIKDEKARDAHIRTYNKPADNFRQFMDQQAELKYGKGQKAWRGGDDYNYGTWSTNTMSNIINETFSHPQYGADIIGKTEIYTQHDDSTGKLLRSELAGVSSPTLRILGLDDNGKYTIEKGTISKQELMKKGYSLRGKGSGLGNVMYINTPDGSTIVTERGNFGTQAEINYNNQVANMHKAALILDNPTRYSPEEVAAAVEVIESGQAATAADQAALLIHTGIGNSSYTTSSDEDDLQYDIPIGSVDFGGGFGGIY